MDDDDDVPITNRKVFKVKEGKEHPESPHQSNDDDDEDLLVVLVLGDGDFSYSYDLARHLAALKAPILRPKKRFQLVATGLDSSEAVSAKYKDSAFLLKNLLALDNTTNNVDKTDDDDDDDAISLQVFVHHGINALQRGLPPGLFRRAHHVLFNHPHLGEENALLHSQFLCHLFHAVSKAWMNKNYGVFHITLVKGQFERWKCLEAANPQGMELICQHPFRSPRVPNPYYQHRRHQTGKSFAARAPQGSVTYTFVRRQGILRNNEDTTTTTSSSSLLGEDMNLLTRALLDLSKDDTAAATAATAGVHGGTNQDMVNDSHIQFPCPHCDKSFREERSVKNHIRSVHPEELDNTNQGDKKRKRENSDKQQQQQQQQSTYACELCLSKDGTPGPRIFNSAQALEDHRKAKHLAAHPVIKPDWHIPATPNDDLQQPATASATTTTTLSGSTSDKPPFGCCDICGATFPDETRQSDHMQAFLPTDITTTTTTSSGGGNNGSVPLPYRCTYCQKEFREQRAQQQHENFCSARLRSLT